ncbi:DUF535 family protein [Paraburkholderia sp. Ac-20347]|uniref:DUF535 family protein n=1 Tax=Paraburkholderia sp. Ac-20347 TaxID=2703892 RepID=UPI0019805F7D|nr:DUF535 family protein [Paraburkholderia sp. Ac-20347]MBN3810624.1 DUF535 domain-containing protein [Paraburkholderia sp. Ac-20347]
MKLLVELCVLLRRAIPGCSFGASFKRIRVLLYSLIYPRAASVWLRALIQDPLLREIALRNRRFIERPFHRIIDADLNTRERALIAREHFRAVRALFGDAVARQIYLRAESVTLARSDPYALVVREPTRCWREGFLTVAWRDERARVDLAWATVSFERDAPTGGLTMRVGGLQGPAGDEREFVRQATRACHGLRPKAAVMEAVCALCRLLHVQALRGVANKRHVSWAAALEFRADYDAFWQELGGVESDGWFSLPLWPRHRNVDDVPSHKRAAFRRRQGLIADVIGQVERRDGFKSVDATLASHIGAVDCMNSNFDGRRQGDVAVDVQV